VKYTNRHGLPEAFVRAIENDPYSRGASDFSATGLAQPARATALIEKFKDTLEIDVSTRVAATIGQGSHVIAERAARPDIDLCEERLFAKFEVDGKEYTVSAQLDLYEMDSGTLHDWKTTKAFAFSKKAGSGKKPEWIEQLNVCAELLRRNGHTPKKLNIIAMLKDWAKRDAGSAGMPESEVLAVELPMWTSEEAVKHIETRIRAHVAARSELPLCGSKETWGGRRCADYCDAASVCTQFKNAQRTGILFPEAQPEVLEEKKKKTGWQQLVEAKAQGGKITLDKTGGE
jgi:hypothetical protein